MSKERRASITIWGINFGYATAIRLIIVNIFVVRMMVIENNFFIIRFFSCCVVLDFDWIEIIVTKGIFVFIGWRILWQIESYKTVTERLGSKHSSEKMNYHRNRSQSSVRCWWRFWIGFERWRRWRRCWFYCCSRNWYGSTTSSSRFVIYFCKIKGRCVKYLNLPTPITLKRKPFCYKNFERISYN